MASRLPACQDVGHVGLKAAGPLVLVGAFRDGSLGEPALDCPTAFAQTPCNLHDPQPLFA